MNRFVPLVLFAVQVLVPAAASGLSVGEKAPAFRAPSTTGPVALEDFRGKKNVVLAFYYRDFTPV